MKVISENVKKQQAELAAQLKAKEEELARAHHAIEELQRQVSRAFLPVAVEWKAGALQRRIGQVHCGGLGTAACSKLKWR